MEANKRLKLSEEEQKQQELPITFIKLQMEEAKKVVSLNEARERAASRILIHTGYIKRNTRYIQSIDFQRSMYLTLVRPIFGYATQIWAPQSVELICRIEKKRDVQASIS